MLKIYTKDQMYDDDDNLIEDYIVLHIDTNNISHFKNAKNNFKVFFKNDASVSFELDEEKNSLEYIVSNLSRGNL